MSQCFDLNVSVSENMIASAHFDGAVRLWSLRTGEMSTEIKNVHDDSISCVRFTPDEKYFVTTGKDHTIRIYDIRTNTEVSKFSHDLYKCGSNTNRLCISSNSKYVVAGSQNGCGKLCKYKILVIIYDLVTNEIEEIYENIHSSAVVACEW